LQVAKKRQLNVRLPDALLTELEVRVQKTKMGMAAMVEVLLVQALQQQETSTSDLSQGDRFDSLVKRIEALELKFADASINSPQIEVIAVAEVLPNTASIDQVSDQVSDQDQVNGLNALTGEELAHRLTVEVRTLNQKKDKSTFADWAKKHDPDGMTWKHEAVEDRFYPLLN